MRTEDEIRADAADGRPFSNHTEFDIWADRHCYDCVNDNAATEKYCPILNVAMLGQGWPREWTRRRIDWTKADGSPGGSYDVVDECTDFEERRDPGDGPEPEPEPPPVCDGQLDIIDAYLPTALDELTPKHAEVRS